MTKQKEDQLIRRNWGYQDGRLMAELRKPFLYAHFDRHYLDGWQEGYTDFRATQRTPILAELHRVSL